MKNTPGNKLYLADLIIRPASGSANWPVTWSDDDNQYTIWGDGGGYGGINSIGRSKIGIARIEGNWHHFEPTNIWGGYDAENAMIAARFYRYNPVLTIDSLKNQCTIKIILQKDEKLEQPETFFTHKNMEKPD